MLTLSEQMYPSFGVNACFFSAKARLFTTQNPAFGAEKPGFPPVFSSGSPVLEKECVSPKSDYPSF